MTPAAQSIQAPAQTVSALQSPALPVFSGVQHTSADPPQAASQLSHAQPASAAAEAPVSSPASADETGNTLASLLGYR